ncbi:MAG: hypothetical protein P8175_17965 [Deltaproteobacteria bacterium]|jgi:hypothetical protein
MHIYRKIYEFAASAGAFEGYLYHKQTLDDRALAPWVHNLVAAYEHLPQEVRDKIGPGLDQTMGRAIQSLTSVLGEKNGLVSKLQPLVAGPMPKSADDFQRTKWHEEP